MIKRGFDILGAGFGLIVLSPILGLAALAVWISVGYPIFFCQMRPGLHEHPFKMIKFRTMSDARDSSGQLLYDGDRLTRVGRFLRASSIDELPGLWNVLKGDMSLVGPRPLLMAYLGRYSPDQARRHDVKPGITGWAQINGRNAITWDEKFALDTWYIDHQSTALDIRILASTVLQLIRPKGINSAESATMPEFIGRGD